MPGMRPGVLLYYFHISNNVSLYYSIFQTPYSVFTHRCSTKCIRLMISSNGRVHDNIHCSIGIPTTVLAVQYVVIFSNKPDSNRLTDFHRNNNTVIDYISIQSPAL